jgi:hypothetical protein
MEWFRGLKNFDEVVVQKFMPASDSILDFPFDRWEFEVNQIYFGTDNYVTHTVRSGGDTKPFDPDTGTIIYWGKDKTPWGNVFPARIIPLHRDLGLMKESSTREGKQRYEGNVVWGHEPVYEPLYFCSTRFVYLVRNGTLHNLYRNAIWKQFKHYYHVECDQGDLYHVFTHEDEPPTLTDREGNPIDLKPIYSQYIKP